MITTKCSLIFEGKNLDFDQITELVGVAPTHTRRAGIQRHPAIEPVDSWELGVEMSRRVFSLDDPTPWTEQDAWPEIMELLGRLARVVENREAVLAEYCHTRGMDVLFVVVILSADSMLPILNIDNDFIQVMARLDAGLSIDPYLNRDAESS